LIWIYLSLSLNVFFQSKTTTELLDKKFQLIASSCLLSSSLFIVYYNAHLGENPHSRNIMYW